MSGVKTLVSRDSAPIPLEPAIRTLALLVVLAVLTTLSHAQSNFTVIHTFTGPDGASPQSVPILNRAGGLYGAAWAGGTAGYGNVYDLAQVNGSWILHPLYSFTGQNDGGNPSGVTIAADGTLFGATFDLGSYGYGTLFNVTPPAHACASVFCPWTDTTLHSFASGNDGAKPVSSVVFDSQGNLYGTTSQGGLYNRGTVYEATRTGDTWNLSVIYSFANGNDGDYPLAVVLDSAGNIYGTTSLGGYGDDGTVFELSPSQGGWTETILHTFTGIDGCNPNVSLVFDQAGNVYGGTGYPCHATIFELSPQGGGWNFTTIYTFSSGEGPGGTMPFDTAGNLYGTSIGGGTYRNGNVFELSPSAGGWTYTDLYDFTGGRDGGAPIAGVTVTGPSGYLYGTANTGGENGDGVVYQVNLGAR